MVMAWNVMIYVVKCTFSRHFFWTRPIFLQILNALYQGFQMRYHLFQKFFGKMVKIKETSLLSQPCWFSIDNHCTHFTFIHSNKQTYKRIEVSTKTGRCSCLSLVQVLKAKPNVSIKTNSFYQLPHLLVLHLRYKTKL